MAKEDVCAPAVRPCHHWLCLLKIHNPRVHLRHTSLFSQVIRRAGRPFSKVRVARSLHRSDDCCHRNAPRMSGFARLLAEMASQVQCGRSGPYRQDAPKLASSESAVSQGPPGPAHSPFEPITARTYVRSPPQQQRRRERRGAASSAASLLSDALWENCSCYATQGKLNLTLLSTVVSLPKSKLYAPGYSQTCFPGTEVHRPR